MHLRDATFYARPRPPVGDVPFEGDLLNRSPFAEKLAQYIDRLREGCVVAIDAPWGTGKTWFGLNWRAALSAGGHRTIFLDAFQRDYTEDPFTVVAAEILKLISQDGDEQQAKSFKRAAVDVFKAVYPTAGKLLVHGVSQAVASTIGLNGGVQAIVEKVEDALADGTERYLEDRLESADEELRSIEHFREILERFAACQEKPVVFFIDELDRCRPDFAVRLIERLKHLFDVPNLVFVLLLNREQLEHAIRGTYGQGVAAREYLAKFVHLFFDLPVSQGTDRYYGDSDLKRYIEDAIGRYKISMTHDTDNFVAGLSFHVSALKLTLRDIDKCVALFAIGFTNDGGSTLAWLTSLKIKRPELLVRILEGEATANHEALSLLGEIDPSVSRAAKFLQLTHAMLAHGFNALDDADKQFCRECQLDRDRALERLRRLAARIDIAFAA